MKRYGRPCLNDLTISGRGMLGSPEYSPEEKNEIRTTLESLTISAQFFHNNAEDQRQRYNNFFFKDQLQRFFMYFEFKLGLQNVLWILTWELPADIKL